MSTDLSERVAQAEERSAGKDLGGDGVAFEEGVVELRHLTTTIITALITIFCKRANGK
jgi:hypothetical protein